MIHTPQHYVVNEKDGVLQLTMPYRTQWFQTIGLIFACVLILIIILPIIIYSYISRIAYSQNIEQPIIYTLLPLFIILLFLAILIIEILWQLIGKEVVYISDESITISHQIFGLGITNIHHADEISGIYVSNQTDLWQSFWINRRYKFWNYKRGRISINCGKYILGGVITDRFGSILDEEGSHHLVSIIISRFPKYKSLQVAK